MAYQNQQFFGAINATTIEKENFIIGSGNFASGSERIADFSVIAGDVNLLRVSQSIYSVGGAVPTDTYIKAIDGSIIYLSTTASVTATGDTVGISTPSGSYLINSASWNDPNNAITVNDISGSDEGQDYAILGVAQRNGAVAKGIFHAYKIKEVVYRDLGTSKISFFVEWGEEGTEADSGDILRLTEKALAVVNLSDTGSLAPGFSLGISGMENLVAGSEFSGYNIALNQYFSYLSASVPATASNAERAISASIADELSGLATASFADYATSASIALEALTASIALRAISASQADNADSASVAARATTLSPDATASFADRATSASIADALSQLATASYALTASHALNVPDTASYAITASYAEYAVSASHEIVKEISSSFADTASFAQSGDGDFSGIFSGSNYSTEFTFEGDTLIVSGNVFVDGTLDAATKNFKINHPTMPGYYLVHSSLEGPERGIYHRGKLKTSSTIHLPDYWKDLPVDDTDITIQLTPIGNACQHFVKSVTREEIEVGCECGTPHCFYIVHAQRYDQGKFEILEPKSGKSL